MTTHLPCIPVPFSPAEVRDRNRDRRVPDDHTESCLFCERPMKPASISYFVQMTVRNEVVPVGAEVAAEDDQGCFPVGPSCKNRVPAEYRMTPSSHPELFKRSR